MRMSEREHACNICDTTPAKSKQRQGTQYVVDTQVIFGNASLRKTEDRWKTVGRPLEDRKSEVA